MSTDERGRWFRVYARQIEEHPKFRDLPGVELGAWTALRSAAELRDRAIIRDRAEALLILRRRKFNRPAAILDDLIRLRLFDVDEAGSIHVHDRKDHDRPDYPSDDPEKARERKQRSRDKSREGHEDVTSRDRDSHDTHARVQQAEPAPAPANSSQPADAPADLPDESDPVTEACRLLPNGGQWLGDADYRVAWDDLVRRFGREWVTEAIPLGYQDCIKRGKVRAWDLKRFTEWHLAKRTRGDELAAEKAQQEHDRAATEAHQRALEEAAPEIQERAEYQKQAIRIGIEKGIPVPTDPTEVRKFVMKHAAA